MKGNEVRQIGCSKPTEGRVSQRDERPSMKKP